LQSKTIDPFGRSIYKYKHPLFEKSLHIFDKMPLAMLCTFKYYTKVPSINIGSPVLNSPMHVETRRVFLCHGGLSSTIPTLNVINELRYFPSFDYFRECEEKEENIFITKEERDNLRELESNKTKQKKNQNRQSPLSKSNSYIRINPASSRAKRHFEFGHPRKRVQEIQHALLWADPADTDIPNGNRCPFSLSTTRIFMAANQIDLIVRAHQYVNNGCALYHENKIMTIFSCIDYSGPNDASMAIIHLDQPTYISRSPPNPFGVVHISGIAAAATAASGYATELSKVIPPNDTKIPSMIDNKIISYQDSFSSNEFLAAHFVNPLQTILECALHSFEHTCRIDMSQNEIQALNRKILHRTTAARMRSFITGLSKRKSGLNSSLYFSSQFSTPYLPYTPISSKLNTLSSSSVVYSNNTNERRLSPSVSSVSPASTHSTLIDDNIIDDFISFTLSRFGVVTSSSNTNLQTAHISKSFHRNSMTISSLTDITGLPLGDIENLSLQLPKIRNEFLAVMSSSEKLISGGMKIIKMIFIVFITD
jgi:diadenosine tetraphosphatase ApaH/serine/threonine PP2A family protein phosphatase